MEQQKQERLIKADECIANNAAARHQLAPSAGLNRLSQHADVEMNVNGEAVASTSSASTTTISLEDFAFDSISTSTATAMLKHSSPCNASENYVEEHLNWLQFLDDGAQLEYEDELSTTDSNPDEFASNLSCSFAAAADVAANSNTVKLIENEQLLFEGIGGA